MIFQTESFLKDNADKVPVDKKSEVENALKDLKDVHAKRDLAGIDRATEALNNVLQTVSQNMYQGANPNQGQPGPDMNQQQNNSQSNDNKNDGDVTDADFEEVK